MGKIIDLTDRDDHEVLSSTGSDGLFGGQYLANDSLQTYLEPSEEPKYVLRNKKSGLDIDGDDARSMTPDDDYQTLALVTDIRILFAAGLDAGNVTESLPLMDIVEARVESGLRSSTLTIETLSDEVWTFPCRGDPAPVASYIEEAAQAWANAARLLDELEESLGRAQNNLEDGNLEAARTDIDGGEQSIRTATARIESVGSGAREKLADRALTLAEWLLDLEREVAAMEAARHHNTAQECWENEEYESAATEYEAALDRYTAAREIDGAAPTDAALQARIRGVVGERELLRIGPLVDADTHRRRAVALADPEEAAAEWEAAHDGYRELLGLEWAESDRQFVADHELIREQTVEIADDAINDHHEAGRRWLTSGDKLAVQGRDTQAEQVYERAKHQFDRAKTLATELRPDRTEAVDAGLAAAQLRLSGELPDTVVPEDPLAWDPDADVTGGAGADEQAPTQNDQTDSEGMEGLSFHDSGNGPTQSASWNQSRRGRTDPDQVDQESSVPERMSSTSVLDKIQAQKRSAVSTAETPGVSPEECPESTLADDTGPGDSETPSPENASETTSGGERAPVSSDANATAVENDSADDRETNGDPVEGPGIESDPVGDGKVESDQCESEAVDSDRNEAGAVESAASQDSDAEGDSDEVERHRQLAALDDEQFRDLVAAVWDADGWLTTEFDGSETVYDIVAVREGTNDRQLVWIERPPEGDEVGKKLIKQISTTLESSQGANSAAVVTTGSLSPPARNLAEENSVTIVETEDFLSYIESADLTDRIGGTVEG